LSPVSIVTSIPSAFRRATAVTESSLIVSATANSPRASPSTATNIGGLALLSQARGEHIERADGDAFWIHQAAVAEQQVVAVDAGAYAVARHRVEVLHAREREPAVAGRRDDRAGQRVLGGLHADDGRDDVDDDGRRHARRRQDIAAIRDALADVDLVLSAQHSGVRALYDRAAERCLGVRGSQPTALSVLARGPGRP